MKRLRLGGGYRVMWVRRGIPSRSNLIGGLAFLLVATGLGAISNAGSVGLALVSTPVAPGCTGCTLSGTNTWELVAKASQGDNFGIAGFSVPVLNVLWPNGPTRFR